MLKRTKGRLLLTLLVVTGFAGTITTSSLSSKERKVIVVTLKENKTDLLKTIRNFSPRQLHSPVKEQQWTIQEKFEHIVAAEAGLWKQLEYAMLQPAKPENRAEITLRDEDIRNMTFSADQCIYKTDTKGQHAERSMQAAVNDFKASRAKQLKYIKTTTEDLRNRVVVTPVGTIDCYQLILYSALHSNAHLEDIESEFKQPGVPQKKP